MAGQNFLGNQARIFIIGYEIFDDLALTGFKYIRVIDLDTIGISNSNHVGKSKAIVAAEFIMNRVPGVLVAPENNEKEKEKTRENGEQMKHGRGISATERTMIRNHREYISLAEIKAGAPIRRSSRSAPREHPRYCIFAHGISVYSNVDVDKYKSLLQVTDFFADHSRQHTIKEVYAMKPVWTAGFSFGFVNVKESFLTAGIENECIIDGVHAQVDETDDETDEDEVADKNRMK
ncbi:hypothetical protein C8R41DRAFT_865140 [Lentinula lateritia]|uniref:Uncharacterized protein n=1 Tax=Lentinula lateritia TaxID=40482 RepID=A0ABQ8VNM0_9AGAR|nr:hypothetical protein C8R41DRAFT_865140 [Lentinula lateritia]